ncbi:uncharacterized protein LOC124188565 isoform X2 [Daphnia pulex]|uniref:uncharacterized protein LOC124188565 isoform X2 n=1 Tax=Daphnia pulex TaxID=6669 RepID=UPI001EDE079F|nr:uncharacterized protein LOC124188565 isoform X2 [Daphnia pulex]
MTIKFSLLFLIALLSAINCGNARGNISMAPANPLYWLDSYIKITCRTSSNIKVKECSWFINDNKIDSGQVYQFSVDEKLRECAIIVKLAATAKNGKWRCLLHLSSTNPMSEISASTHVNILDLSLREFVIIICGIPIFLAMIITIVGLVVKNRRSVTFMEHHQSYFVASAPVILLEDGFNSPGSTPPPPSYDTVVSARILADEFARLEFSGIPNDAEDHTSLRNGDESGNNEQMFKTRSAPNLIVT